MTSSLVGSEMCIRDRGFPSPDVDILLLHLAEVASLLVHVRGDTSLPVSYTHLTLPTICSV
eukprot:11463762-Prorocentrum_lima.AAC.1